MISNFEANDSEGNGIGNNRLVLSVFLRKEIELFRVYIFESISILKKSL